MEKCMNDIQDSEYYPKLRTYKTFKLQFKQEIYLSEIKDYRYIIALARFHINSHNLAIETAWYLKPKLEVNLRKCTYCDSHETEDEVHFLNKCTLFTNEHKLLYSKCSKYIHNIYIMNHNVAFIHIMTSTEPSVKLATAKYLFTCFNKRMQINI